VVLRNARPPKKSLSKAEFLSLKSLKDNPDIFILKVDKGGAVVILDKPDYIHKMVDHLSSSGSYIKLKKNPIKSISKEVAIRDCAKVFNEYSYGDVQTRRRKGPLWHETSYASQR